MVLSYSHQMECPPRPPYCQCENRQKANFQRRGCYFRRVAQAFCHFFFCTTCKTHITMLPSNCVPYKQFPAEDIEYCLGEAVEGRFPADIEGDVENKMGVHRFTILTWLNQWIISSAELASISSETFSGIISGSCKAVFRTLFSNYSGRGFFKRLQPDLCRNYPPMGIFRPLIKLSLSGQD